ncbi:alpha/beta hydrolase fold protein [Penicillium nucicola]|uniref:alpha/beta hydrolase fold protein n=1 Tax=Penicillium nucicola TaxID=1850975 RepID=UPI00254592FA|nr:alpha/beta hydrolase fold protein [Penicillium nucicola]KAJ5771107.1 alpha/beta hydrolase fold protein [Penicillium nucicola]
MGNLQKGDMPSPPLPKVRLSLWHRINCFIWLWAFKFFAITFFVVRRFLYPLGPATRPALIKYYPCRSRLQCRIFFPPGYKPGQLLPLYFNIHGGGFASFDAELDDGFSSSWAARTGMMVVSLSYRKAPLYPFPTASYDIHALATAILADETLPIDQDRVVIGGFSAGGQLALSASQLPGLKGIVKASIIYYPTVDFSIPPDEKLALRPYSDGPTDTLETTSWWFDWAFVSPGQNRRDPLLSPCYAKREDLPPYIYCVGAQWDMLRFEAQQMIHELADLEHKENQDEPFETEKYKWTLAMGCSHGFTTTILRDPKRISLEMARTEEVYNEAHQWLMKKTLA